MFKLFADYLTYDLLKLQRGQQLSESLNFFFYDVPKIFFMLFFIMFFVSILRSFFPPKRIKEILSHKHAFVGNILAAVLGIFMPFCTCSAIPLFIGMIESGVPLGIAMSFIISSPTINEVAVILLFGIFGWKITATYIISGLVVAVLGGYIIGWFFRNKKIEETLFIGKSTAEDATEYKSWKERFAYAYSYTLDMTKSIWLYVLIGIAIGALIHGYIPKNILLQYAGKNNPFAVIFAVIIGIPVYANCAGAIPVAQALMSKGLPLGTSLAFLMAVTGLSLPEFLILSKVLKPRLLLTLFTTVGIGIILIGYLFNLIF